MPILTVLVTPGAALIPVVVVTSILFLALLGGFGAYADGAPLMKIALRVTFWGALAVALTAVVGHCSERPCKFSPDSPFSR